MDNFETYFSEVILKKLLPSLIRGALAGLVALIAAHQGLLQSLGVVYTPSVDQITLNLTTFSKWLLIVGGGGITAFFALIQHHTIATIQGTPQLGAPTTPPPAAKGA